MECVSNVSANPESLRKETDMKEEMRADEAIKLIEEIGLVPFFRLLRNEILERIEHLKSVIPDLETVIKKLEGE